MNPLQQYIDLAREQMPSLCGGCSEPVNALREKALHTLEGVSLPRIGAEDYEQTDLAEILSPDYGLNINRHNLGLNPSEPFKCKVPALSTALYFLMGDMFAKSSEADRQLPEGVVVCSLRQAPRLALGILEKYYGKIAPLSNPIVALDSLLVQDGLLLYVPRGVKVEKPIQLVSIMGGQGAMMAARRLLIVIEDEAQARLLCCDHTQTHDKAMLPLQTIEIFVGKRACFDIYELEESSRLTRRLSALYLHQEESSNVLIDSITLSNGQTRNEFHCSFKASDASLRLLGMGTLNGSRRLDNLTRIDHSVPACHSDELMKYIVEEEATGAFTGRIYVAHGAEKTEAYQANRNMVTSEQARMYSKPQLEIYNDDVKCSHGTAVGQMDEKQLFYMQQRGLSLPVAHTLLKQAFLADVVEGVRLQPLRDRLRMLLDRRFAQPGSPEHDCSACASMNC